nr:MAG TPA: hypothetical protein [Caudoviricetes sp.]
MHRRRIFFVLILMANGCRLTPTIMMTMIHMLKVSMWQRIKILRLTNRAINSLFMTLKFNRLKKI